jgi:co-chaperonin GroES (HSP10)
MKVHTVHPALDMVEIEKIPYDEKTDAGLFIPEGTQRFYCRVRSVGPGRRTTEGGHVPICVQPGARILLWGGLYDFLVEGRKVLMVKDEAVCAELGPDLEDPVEIRSVDGTSIVRRHVIHPKHNFLLLEKLTNEGQTDAGVHVIEGEDQANVFRVLRAGPGRFAANGVLEPMPCKDGDIVLIPGGANDAMCEGRKILMKEADYVLAVLGPEIEETKADAGMRMPKPHERRIVGLN